MQRTPTRLELPRCPGSDPQALAAELAEAWEEIGRFVLNRRLQSGLYGGIVNDLSRVHALAVLARGDRRMSQLAAELGLAESTVTRLVDRLEEAGLVHRRADPADRRLVVAGLTAAGRRLVRRAEAHRRAYLADLLEALEPGERLELVRLLGKVGAELRRRAGSDRAEGRPPGAGRGGGRRPASDGTGGRR